MIKKLFVLLLLVFTISCAAPRNFHSRYYFENTVTYSEEALSVDRRYWWDCTEIAYAAYHKLVKKYKNAEIAYGYIDYGNSETNLIESKAAHAWVEYDGDKVFDFMKQRHNYVKHDALGKGLQIYNFIRTEQFLRYLGYEAGLKVYDFNMIGGFYKAPQEKQWRHYQGELDYLRKGKYKWVE